MISICNLQGQEVAKSSKRRWALQAGIGGLYSGAGLMMEYQLPIAKKLKLGPFVSLGSQGVLTQIPGIWIGGVSGLNLEFGNIKLNTGADLGWLVGINYGSQGVGSGPGSSHGIDSSTQAWIHAQLLKGFSCIMGYKFTNCAGFIWQVHMGMSYIQNPLTDHSHYFFRPTGGFGIGYKF